MANLAFVSEGERLLLIPAPLNQGKGPGQHVLISNYGPYATPATRAPWLGNYAPAVPTTVNVSPSTPSIVAGDTQAFTAEVLDQYDNTMDGQTVTWASDDEAVATVDTDGVATGVAEGTCTITATCEGVDGTASLEVTAPLGSGRVAPMRLSLSLSL